MQRNRHAPITMMFLVVLAVTTCTSPREPSTPTFTAVLTTSTPTILLGELIKAEKGGFAYKPLIGYKVRNSSDSAVISNDKDKVMISLVSTISKNLTIFEVLNFALGSFGLIQIGEPQNFTLNGVDGIKVKVNTDAFFDGAHGEVVVLTPAENRFFTAIAIAGDSGIGWNPAGKKLFDDVLKNVNFFEPSK